MVPYHDDFDVKQEIDKITVLVPLKIRESSQYAK
jgi:hypothetical protein